MCKGPDPLTFAIASRTSKFDLMFQNIGEMVVLFWRTLASLPSTMRQRQKVLEQFFEIGNASLLMVCILSFFIGGVITLHTGPLMVERGLANAVGGLVGIAICKELAPVMMSILIAGRIGSAMTAEIGSMQVYQEIDALRTMNINPIHYLVLPRMSAIAVALPLLVIFAVLYWLHRNRDRLGGPASRNPCSARAPWLPSPR